MLLININMKNRIACALVLLAGIPISSQAGTIQVTPSISLREEYNDNILFDFEKEARADFISRVSPKIEFIKKTERISMGLSSSIEAIEHMDNADFDSIDHSQKALLDYNLTPLLKVFSNLDFTQDSRPDRELQTSGLLLNSSKRKTLAGSAGAQYILTEKLYSLVNLSYTNSSFEDPRLVDSKVYGLNCGLGYNLGTYIPRTTGRVSLGHNKFEYPFNTVKNYILSVGLSHDLSETYSIALDIGPRYSQSRLFDQVSEEVGLGGSLKLNYSGEKTSINLTVSREEQGVSGSSGTAQRSSVSFSVGHNVSAELQCNLDLEYRNNSSTASSSSGSIDEDYFAIAPRTKYSFTRNLSLETEFRYAKLIDRTIIKGDDSRDRNQLFVRINYQHPLFD